METDPNLNIPFPLLSSNFLSWAKWHGLFNRPQSSDLLMYLTVLFYFSGKPPTLHLPFIPQELPLPSSVFFFFPALSGLAFVSIVLQLQTEAASTAGQPGSWRGCLGFICSSYIDFILVSKAMNDLKAGFC